MKSFLHKLRSSLTLRIFLLTALILMLACTATYLFLVFSTPITYQTITSDNLREKTNVLLADLQKVTLADSEPLFEKFISETDAEITVTDPDGNLVLSLPDAAVYENEAVTTVTEGTAGATAVDSFFAAFEGPHYGVGAIVITSSDWNESFRFAGDDTAYALTIISSLVGVNQTVEAINRVMPYLFLLILAISLVGALFFSRYLTRPIVRLSGISERMAQLDFSWKSEEKRQDEIGILGRNLDTMSQRLSTALEDLKVANTTLQADIDRERELERQRTAFFAAASHELKTPVTVLKGQLSGMLGNVDIYKDRDKYLARSLAVTGRMESLIQEMLTVSRMEKTDGLTKCEPVDFSALVRRQVQQAEDLAVQREQALSADLAPALSLMGDETLLSLAVSNLLTNALTYSPPGSATQVRLWQVEGSVHLTVENSGVQIPAAALPHLCEAFYRVEGSRNRESGGSGLGLYLVKMILERHRAALTLQNTQSGVLAAVTFPA